MARGSRQRELGRIADRVLAPHWGRGEYSILSPRKLRRIKRREVLVGISPQGIMDFARKRQPNKPNDI